MESYKEAESTPPQHFAPWQKKSWQNHLQLLTEAQDLPPLGVAQ
jgi:hypothetical protein